MRLSLDGKCVVHIKCPEMQTALDHGRVACGIDRGVKVTEDTARQVCDIVRFLLLSQRKDRVKRGFY